MLVLGTNSISATPLRELLRFAVNQDTSSDTWHHNSLLMLTVLGQITEKHGTPPPDARAGVGAGVAPPLARSAVRWTRWPHDERLRCRVWRMCRPCGVL